MSGVGSKALVVIPARFASTRLPGKPLADIGGKPLIRRVYEQAKKLKTAGRVIVATDDERILETVEGFGGKAVMTDKKHPSGTDRVAEVAEDAEESIVVNIQGDEPFFDTDAVDRAVKTLMDNPSLKVATLRVPIDEEEANDPNVTCVVCDKKGNALYFSKLPIPNDRDGNAKERPLYKHLGVYIFRREYLLVYSAMPPSPLELCEKLEQLRILESGEKIFCEITDTDSIGVDSPEDLARAKKIIEEASV